MSFLHNPRLLLFTLRSKNCVTAFDLGQDAKTHTALGECDSLDEVYGGHRVEEFRGIYPIGVASIGNSSLFYVSFNNHKIIRVNYKTNQTDEFIQPTTGKWKPFMLNYDSHAYGLLVMRSIGLFNISHPEASPNRTSLDKGTSLMDISPEFTKRTGFVRIKGSIWVLVHSKLYR